jgi:hypothetical protein
MVLNYQVQEMAMNALMMEAVSTSETSISI